MKFAGKNITTPFPMLLGKIIDKAIIYIEIRVRYFLGRILLKIEQLSEKLDLEPIKII